MRKRIFVFAIFIVLLICSSIIAAKFEPFMQIQTLVVGTIKGDGAQLTGLTKTQVGLSNVDNTSDANKPVSSATQTALNNKEGTQAAASQVEAEAGTESGIRSWSPLRVFQAISAKITAMTFGTFTGTTIADNPTIPSALQALETAVELRAVTTAPGEMGATTPYVSHARMVELTVSSTPVTLTTAQLGGVVYVTTGGSVINLPAGSAAISGLPTTIFATAAVTFSVDPNGTEILMLYGTALAGGNKITTDGAVTSGFTFWWDNAASRWRTRGGTGALVDGGA